MSVVRKKLTAAIIAILLICSMLSGCGGSEAAAPNEDVETPVSTEQISEDLSTVSPTDDSVDGEYEQAAPSAEVLPTSTESPDSVRPTETITPQPTSTVSAPPVSFSLSDVPAYSGSAYVAVNGNEPYFSNDELTTDSFESYSSLDSLGRCGVAYACIGTDIMPTEERGSIGQVKPTGWHTVRYDGVVDGNYLYNRCHLIGYQLSGENANERNLITGTRSMNVDGMLPLENMVADYVKETNNHVLYRVTPCFDGNNLLATGVLMEAKSVEDDGEGILYCVFVYNVQPGVGIDYATGDSWLDESSSSSSSTVITLETPAPTAAPTPTPDPEPDTNSQTQANYVLNTNTYKFHYPSCSSVNQMKESNKQYFSGTREEVIAMGYDPCGRCNP